MNLVTLQTKTSLDYQENLDNLISLIKQVPQDSLVLASELCLTGYSYDNLEGASTFSKSAIKKLLELSKNMAIGLTLTTKKEDKFYNTFYLLHQEKIIHKQSKVKLFALNQENLYFAKGCEDEIFLFEYNGLKIGVLICFELRFIELWQKLKGADIILIPAMWGEKRKKNFEQLSQALAVANQCFVIASNSSNEDCSKSSSIISPFGEFLMDDSKELISQNINLKEIKLMRKYLPTGL